MPRRKKAKYKKTHLEAWKCNSCEFEWCYKTVKCPVCSSKEMLKII